MHALQVRGDWYARSFRTFRTSVSAALLTLLASGSGACRGVDARHVTDQTLVIGFVAPISDVGHAAARGAQLGAEEAERTGLLLGHTVQLHIGRADDVASTTELASRMIDNGAHAVVGGFDDAVCAALDALAAARTVVFVNVGCRADALRATSASGTFHVEASDSMYLSAMALGRASGGAAPVLWHPLLARYGAAQLNQRFVRRFGLPADAAAWSSWMALKLLAESSFKSGIAPAGETQSPLAVRLVGEHMEFDGHKGEALRFDPVTQQLRQPLFAPPLVRTGNATRVRPDEESVTDIEREALRRAFAEEASLLVVSNEGSFDVSILHAARAELLATLRFADRPRGVQVSEDGRTAWVALSDEAPTQTGDGDAIAEIDLVNGRVRARHRAGSDPEQFAVSADGRVLVASNEDAGTATITSLRAQRGENAPEHSSLLVGIEPEGVALSPDAQWAYVTAETSNTVSVIDVPARAVVASFLVDERPRAVAFAPDGRRAYVTNEISSTLTVVDATRHAVTHTLLLAQGRARPVGVRVSSDGLYVYVANGHANSVSVIETATLREISVIAVGRRPWGLALSRDGQRLYSANGGSGNVSVIDVAARVVVATINVGERPWGVAVTR